MDVDGTGNLVLGSSGASRQNDRAQTLPGVRTKLDRKKCLHRRADDRVAIASDRWRPNEYALVAVEHRDVELGELFAWHHIDVEAAAAVERCRNARGRP